MNKQTNQQEPTSNISFEAAFARLEQILEKMNSGTISLDESLKLYEEADHLIRSCNERLQNAERKIEMLIKNRNGDLLMGSNQKPMTQDYPSGSAHDNPAHHKP